MENKGLSIREYAQISVIPRKVLLYLQRKKIIEEPLGPEALAGLQLLEQVWGDPELLRPQIARMSRHAREQFLRTAELYTKWERYVYSRYFNQEKGKALPLQQVIEELQITFGFELNGLQIRRIRSIRARAQSARYRQKKRNVASDFAETKK